MEMRTDFRDVPETTAIASAVRRKITWKMTAKEKKLRMSNIAAQQPRTLKKAVFSRSMIKALV